MIKGVSIINSVLKPISFKLATPQHSPFASFFLLLSLSYSVSLFFHSDFVFNIYSYFDWIFSVCLNTDYNKRKKTSYCCIRLLHRPVLSASGFRKYGSAVLKVSFFGWKYVYVGTSFYSLSSKLVRPGSNIKNYACISDLHLWMSYTPC